MFLAHIANHRTSGFAGRRTHIVSPLGFHRHPCYRCLSGHLRLSTVRPNSTPQFKMWIQLIKIQFLIVCVGFSMNRLGILVDFLSHSTILGFMGGTAVIISLQQLKGMLGLTHFTSKTDVFSVLHAVFTRTNEVGLFLPFIFSFQFSFTSKTLTFLLFRILCLAAVEMAKCCRRHRLPSIPSVYKVPGKQLFFLFSIFS